VIALILPWRFHMKVRLSLILLSLCLLTPAAHAAGFNLGGSIGQSDLEDDRGGLNFNDRDTGWKLFFGFRFLKFFGVEGGYQDFGNPRTSLAGASASYHVDGWDVFAVGVVPIKKFEIFGKVGLIYSDTRFSSTVQAPESKDGVNLAYGLGVGWRFTDHFAIRGEYEVFDLDSVDHLTFLSIGAEFRF
jgi:OOP family OmpA-OmpF porin